MVWNHKKFADKPLNEGNRRYTHQIICNWYTTNSIQTTAKALQWQKRTYNGRINSKWFKKNTTLF